MSEAEMKHRFTVIITVFLLFLLLGCSKSNSGSNAIDPFGEIDPELDRIIELDGVSVNESHIFIYFSNDKYFLNVPVTLESGRSPLNADVTISVDTLFGESVSDMKRSSKAEITDKTEKLDIDLGKDYLPAAEELPKLVLKYSLKWGDKKLSGAVSMFRISPRTKTQVLGADTIVDGEESIFRIFVNDMLSGSPVDGTSGVMKKDISAELFSGDTPLGKFTAKVDEFGMATLPLSLEELSSPYLKMVVTTETAYGTKSVVVPLHATSRAEGAKTLLTTDKPLYQPGQTIHIRTLSLQQGTKEPLADVDFTFEITDPKGNKVFKEHGKTSEFGIYSTDFKLASLVNLGNYTISALIGGEKAAEKTVTVERYVLPKFDITVSFDKGFYMPGDTVKAKLSSNYFYGKPVSKGALHVEVKTTDVSENTIQIIDATLSENGEYSFNANLPYYLTGSALDQGAASVKFEITVTDTANHAQSVVKSVKVVQDPINIALVPAAGKILPGVGQRMYLILTDPLGAPVASAAKLEFGDETEEIVVDESGFAEFDLLIPEEGRVWVTAAANGKSVTRDFRFTSDGSSEFIFITTDSPIYDAEDEVELEIFTGYDPNTKQPELMPDRAYLDIVADGQIRSTRTIVLEEGRGLLKLDLDETMHGVVEFLAYYLTKEGNIIRASKAVYVRKASSLNVNFTTDKEEYKPRETAKARFEVKDAEGNPVTAALGVSMVDEAVFHVMDFLPGMEKTYFDVESAVMESNYAIYGTSYNEIVTPVDDEEQEEEIEKRAEAFFADNAGNLTHGVSAEDYSEYERLLRNYSEEAVEAKAQKFAEENHFSPDNCENSGFNEEKLSQLLKNPKYADPWGNIMKGEISWISYGWIDVTLTSAGPDEIAGSGDDIETEVEICERSYKGGDDDDIYEDGSVDTGDTGADYGDTDAWEEPSADTGEDDNHGSSVKVREWFPETLYFNPQLITDENGVADIDVLMADSITSWRVTALANSITGGVGSMLGSIRVFQDFFVDIDFPVFLTQNDEISVPVGIYNYLGEDQHVTLEAQSEPWFEMTGDTVIEVDVPANSVSAVYFPIRVLKIGEHSLTVIAQGSRMSDAIKRSVTVKPDGIMAESTRSELLDSDKNITLTIPAEAIPDSAELFVKIYPGMMSQAIEGLDSMLEIPYGCFEQTTSTTYPNVLVLQYMTKAGNITPEIELKARDYISQGYQRLLTYEVPGGGFEWFGDEPAHFVLTSLGLLEFVDMSKVHEVDPKLITRTAAWMASQQNPDGSFNTNNGPAYDVATTDIQASALRSTAYGAWALTSAELEETARSKAVSYIESKIKGDEDTYTMALAAIALLGNGGSSSKIEMLVNKLLEQKIEDEDQGIHWEQSTNTETYGYGDSAEIETTSLVGLLLLEKGGHADVTAKILNWIIRHKDSIGNWGATQATISALKFLVKSLDSSTESETTATIRVKANESPETLVQIEPENSDVLRLIDLKEHLVYGENNIAIKFEGTGSMMYQATATWYVPAESGSGSGPLEISVSYDKTNLSVNDTVDVKVDIKNVSGSGVTMILATIGIAPGFTLIPYQLDYAIENGDLLQRYETTPRHLILYLSHIDAGETATLRYQLMADYPIEASTGEATVHPYYNPEEKFSEAAQRLNVAQ